MQNTKIYKGAFIIALGGFLSKIAGAVYRVPLTSLLGAEGLGIYQMAFPVYAMLLDLSSAGVPNAMASLIASSPNKKDDYLSCAVRVFGALGFLGSVLMLILAKPLATFQGNAGAYYIYAVIAPSVVFVGVGSAIRGYFQGQMKMFPTTLSQLIEQGGKIAVGLALIYSFNSVKMRVVGAGLAVTFSEVFGFIYLILHYGLTRKKCADGFCRLDDKNGTTVSSNITKQQNKTYRKSLRNSLIKKALPITALAIVFPLSQIADSSLIINFLGAYRSDALKVFGIFSGAVMSVINLPVSVCYGLSAVAVPVLSAKTGARNKTTLLILSTLVLAICGALCCYIFSPLAVRILFPRLGRDYQVLTYTLIKALSPMVIFSALLQTFNAVLIAKNKTYHAIVGCVLGCLIKIVLEFFLLKTPSINIFGAVISHIACYLLACFFNLLYIKKYADKENSNGKIPNGK